MDINEPIDKVLSSDPQRYDFLGVTYDHARHSTTIKASLREKLRAALALISLTSSEQLTLMHLRNLLSILGTVQYASQISGNHRAKYYTTLKFFRRRAAANALLDAPAEFWPCAVPQLIQWITYEINAPPRTWNLEELDPEFQAVLYTDASNTGMGAVLYRPDGSISVVATRWDSDPEDTPHINILEAKAILHALDTLRMDDLLGIHLKIDNTSVMYCLQKTLSRSFELNRIIEKILEHRNFGKILSIAYIASANNRSDVLSRLSTDLRFQTRNPLFGKFLVGTDYAGNLESISSNF